MREFEFINRIKAAINYTNNPIIKSIGDDCAILPYTKTMDMLITTDTICEGVHFSSKYFKAGEIGARAFTVSVSDICAMGGKPLYALVNIAYPKNIQQKYIDTLFKGLLVEATKYKTDIIGGDTISSSQLVISVTVIGKVEKGKALLRNRAKPGDSVYVTGTLGDSFAGLQILTKKKRSGLLKHELMPVNKHIAPQPHFLEGRLLLKSNMVNACMDVSDGLVSDIERICEESKTGAEILVDDLPVSFSVLKTAEQYHEKISNYALYGGEDFVLMFTVADKYKKTINQYMKKNRKVIYEIGRITRRKGIMLLKDGNKIKETGKKVWKHF